MIAAAGTLALGGAVLILCFKMFEYFQNEED